MGASQCSVGALYHFKPTRCLKRELENNYMKISQEEIFKIMADEFILEFYKYYKSLNQLGYSIQKIAEIMKHSSKIEILSIFLKNSNIQIQKKEELSSVLNQLKQIIEKEQKLKVIDENNFFGDENITELINKLNKYLDIIALSFPSICYEEYSTKNNIIVKDFYDLNIKAKLDYLKNPPYKKIQIQEKDGKYKFLVMDLHPASVYREENSKEILPKIIEFLEILKSNTQKYTEKDWLKNFSIVLFDSLFPITRELGVCEKIPKSISQKIEKEHT